MKLMFIINGKLIKKETNIMINLKIVYRIFSGLSLENRSLKLISLKKEPKDSKNKK